MELIARKYLKNFNKLLALINIIIHYIKVSINFIREKEKKYVL